MTLRLWHQVGVGIAASKTTRNGSADVDARIPHPLFFQQPRTVSGSQSGVSDTQTGIHFQLSYAIPATRHLTITLSGGPSYVRVSQDLVTDIKYSESYPYDVATFTSAATEQASAGALGFNVGGDVAWMFTRAFGIGGLVRYTRATVDLESKDRANLRRGRRRADRRGHSARVLGAGLGIGDWGFGARGWGLGSGSGLGARGSGLGDGIGDRGAGT